MKKKEYSKEFKDSAIQLALSQERTKSSVARELGIPEWKLRDWVSAYKNVQLKTLGMNGKGDTAKVLELEKENKRLKMELEILKKAAAYFAKTLQ